MVRTIVLVLSITLAAHVHTDGPYVSEGDDGKLQCSIEATGTSSRPYVDGDTPSTDSRIELHVHPKQERVHLVSAGGYMKHANKVWRENLTDTAGSTITYQVGSQEPVELMLPLKWANASAWWHHEHDGSELRGDEEVALFDITRTTLGEYLLEIDGNPEPVAIKHQAVIDHGFKVVEVLRYRVASETTTITFKHFAEAKAFCDRANAEDEGLMGWFSD